MSNEKCFLHPPPLLLLLLSGLRYTLLSRIAVYLPLFLMLDRGVHLDRRMTYTKKIYSLLCVSFKMASTRRSGTARA
jgi:hypothetical protein